jgi:translation initiation factor IF-2
MPERNRVRRSSAGNEDSAWAWVSGRLNLADKMRVHNLAKELNVSSKVILEKCKAEGLDNVVKNHMSTVSAGLYATIKEWFTEGESTVAIETSARVDLKKVRTKPKRKRAPKKAVAKPAETEVIQEAAKTEVEKEPVTPAAALPSEEIPAAASAAAEAPAAEPKEAVRVPPEARKPPLEEEPAVATPEPPTPAAQPEAIPIPPDQVQATPAPEVPGKERRLPAAQAPAFKPPEAEETVEKPHAGKAAAKAPRTEPGKEKREPEKPEPLVAAGPQNVPAPTKLKGPRVVRYEPLTRDHGPRRPSDRPGEATVGDLPLTPDVGDIPTGRRGRGSRRARVNPRRAAGRAREATEQMAEWRDRDLIERGERLAGASGRRFRRRAQAATKVAVVAPEHVAKAKVHEPVRMKDFCSATGLNFMQCFKVLKDEHNILANINMTLPNETAELLALQFGMDLEIVPMKTQLDMLEEEAANRQRDNLQARPPVVTLLGHVDHGKTSLLDCIRKTHVVETEDGGITQHIGAYHVKGSRGAVTFLDTPGHEAFSAMRARGAKLTDVAVLVIAADDGVMPQTIEAINHAKAAEVPIVVALNKIDLGEENVLKIYGQLAEQGLTPSGDWGGDTDVIYTSATTRRGVTDLVDHLADLTELLDLKADPTLPAIGTVIEAQTKTGVGPVVSVLVQEGMLEVGDVVVCGNAFGKVRALLDDLGRRVPSARPSTPVELWGLDDVPTSGDRLYAVDNLQRAKTIATEVKQSRLQSSRQSSRKVTTLEAMFQQRDEEEVPELNLVVKADVDGSVEMLRQTLAEIPTEEVKLTIRHAGVGAVTDGDVLLASTCDGLVVAYRVEVPATVRKLADRQGVEIRSYRVVYDVNDDIKKALEGLLEPEVHEETRGTAEVRELFRISRLGLVAGCYVTDGTVDRNHFARVIRNGVVVRDDCRIASLRRFKDDAKEVRAGLECGIRLDDFDDVHTGDTIETYEVVEVARVL